jgi:tRNA A37 threonylcarbamoyladenosine modification protein TsaB
MKRTLPAARAHQPRPSFTGLRVAISIGLFLGVLCPLHASPLLRCQIDQGGSTQIFDFPPVSDPYPVKAIDINSRFRFKAVVMGDTQQIEYIKVYVYSQGKRQPILLHQAKYLSPLTSTDPSFAALTGINYVYSPQLERELKYGCALLETSR